tara:strand:+ start:1265 stop:1408 length:144 start_codon:yes stop_codon:yes gene_type:complete
LDILFKVLKDDGVTPPIDIADGAATVEETKVSSPAASGSADGPNNAI